MPDPQISIIEDLRSRFGGGVEIDFSIKRLHVLRGGGYWLWLELDEAKYHCVDIVLLPDFGTNGEGRDVCLAILDAISFSLGSDTSCLTTLGYVDHGSWIVIGCSRDILRPDKYMLSAIWRK